MTRSLAGKTLLITGAASGIGKGIALVAARAGATVLLADVDELNGAAVAADIQAAGGEARFFRMDVTSEADVAATLQSVGETFGKLDILVNNAGASPRVKFADMDLQTWRQILDLNLTSVYLCTHAALRLLERAINPSVINIASMHAFKTVPGLSAYAAAKGGVVSLTQSLALELAPHIRVNAVAPGLIETEGWVKSVPNSAKAREERLHYHPVGRLGVPADIAACVLFLGSDEASYLTGVTLPVAGGLGLQLYP